MQTRSVLFDLDGTLVDSLPGIEFSVDCALAQCGMPPRTRQLRPLIGPPIRSILSELLGRPDEQRLSAAEAAFRSSYDSTGWSKTIPAEGALDTLRAFQSAGLQLFVVTNKPAAATRLILDHLGIREVFSDVVCRDSKAPAYASKAAMLQELIDARQLQPGQCLYVGDTSEDYRAAKEVGVPVAIVSYGYGDPDAVHPDAIPLHNLTELLAIVETMEMS